MFPTIIEGLRKNLYMRRNKTCPSEWILTHGKLLCTKVDISFFFHFMNSSTQNFTKNCDIKRHLLELSWFFGNKTFLYFKIEGWNFQHLFETLWNMCSLISIRQNYYFVFFPWFDMKLFVDFWRFTRIYNDLQKNAHKIVFVLTFVV